MNKLKIVFLSAFMLIAFDANARYVRKLREPDFFIPEQDRMHKPEKLPEINFLVNNDRKMENFTKIPDYKLKYSEYLADMNAFAKNKILPENQKLNNDLAAMENGSVFEVVSETDNKISTKEQKEFYSLVEKMIYN